MLLSCLSHLELYFVGRETQLTQSNMKKDARKKLKVVINEDKLLSPKQGRRKGEAYFHGLSVHCDTVNSVVIINVRRDR